MRIKIYISTSVDVNIIHKAIVEAGTKLNGNTELDYSMGTYNGPNPGVQVLSCDKINSIETILLSDKFFNGKEQNMTTVQNAVLDATGIKFILNSSDMIVGHDIMNQKLYEETIKKQIEWEANYLRKGIGSVNNFVTTHHTQPLRGLCK